MATEENPYRAPTVESPSRPGSWLRPIPAASALACGVIGVPSGAAYILMITLFYIRDGHADRGDVVLSIGMAVFGALLFVAGLLALHSVADWRKGRYRLGVYKMIGWLALLLSAFAVFTLSDGS